MFSETAQRDSYVKDRNVKNTFDEYQKILDSLNVNFIMPRSDQNIILENGKAKIENIPDLEYLAKENANFYLSNYKKDYPFNALKIIRYLKGSKFIGKQILHIIPTDDSFKECIGEVIFADFQLGDFKTISETEIIKEKKGYRVMQLKVRAEVIMCVVENYLPWEDMSIGFQLRASRCPNDYESDFWYHFTNNYIAEEHFRYSSYCGSCTVIDQNPIWAKSNIKS
jgi:CMP-N-acetylneuraminate monooxygenase